MSTCAKISPPPADHRPLPPAQPQPSLHAPARHPQRKTSPHPPSQWRQQQQQQQRASPGEATLLSLPSDRLALCFERPAATVPPPADGRSRGAAAVKGTHYKMDVPW